MNISPDSIHRYRLLHNHDCVLSRVDDDHYQLFDQYTDTRLRINDACALVWSLCDRPVSFADVLHRVHDRMNVAVSEFSLEPEVFEAVKKLHEKRVLHLQNPDNDIYQAAAADLAERKLAKRNYVNARFNTTEFKLKYPPEIGFPSDKAERLVRFCLGRYANESIPEFSASYDYFAGNSHLVWCETGKKHLYLRNLPGRSGKARTVIEQKKIVPAWISQGAQFPSALRCWLVTGDTPDPRTVPEQGPHVGICRPPESSHVILAPGSNRDRVLGHLLSRQLKGLRRYDVPWEQKTDTAWWGGTTSGGRSENPSTLSRFRFLTWTHANPTPRINLDLVGRKSRWNADHILPEPTGKFSKNTAFSNKCLILLKGNDVPSGLSWFFCSNSVVMMQPPLLQHILTFEMEPWVHYVPLEPNPADVLVKLDWVLTHQEEAKEITRRARQHLAWLTGPEYLWACNQVLRRIASG